MNQTSQSVSAARLDPLEGDLLVSRVMAVVRETPQQRPAGRRAIAGAGGVLLVGAMAVALAGGLLSARLPGGTGAAGAAGASAWTLPAAGVSLFYPAGWTVSTVPWPVGGKAGSATFLGTVPATVTMVPLADGSGGYRFDGFVTALTPGSVVVRILVDDGRMSLGTFLADPATATATQIGGRPAITGPSVPLGRTGADASTTWVVALGDANGRRIVITALMAGPGLDALLAQVDALVASISFAPAATPTGG
jgi:hypothetical protein